MAHLDEKILLSYLSQLLADEQQLMADNHIAECSECRKRLKSLFYLGSNIDLLWPTWTAAEHGRIYKQWQLVKALRQAAQTSATLTQRAAQWAEQLIEGIELGTKVLVSGAQRAAIIAAGILPAGYEFQLRPAYAGVCSAEQIVLQDCLKKSSEYLAAEQTAESLNQLAEAVKIDARAVETMLSEMSHKGNLRFQIFADGRRARIWVKCWPVQGQPMPLLAAVLPKAAEDAIKVSQFKPVQGEQYFLAEFENLADGAYSVFIESIVQKLNK